MNNIKAKIGASKHTFNKKVCHYADIASEAWNDLNVFVDTYCKHSGEYRDAFIQDLCLLVDKYAKFNSDAYGWCQNHGIDPSEFFCEVNNKALKKYWEKEKRRETRSEAM